MSPSSPTDVRDERDGERLAEPTLERFGGWTSSATTQESACSSRSPKPSEPSTRRVFDTNVWGIFTCARHPIPRMVEGGSGLAWSTSARSRLRSASRPTPAYCASKGAVHALTRQMALDYADAGVRVNCVAPGFIETEQVRAYLESHNDPVAAELEVVAAHPLGRMGRPEEVAAPWPRFSPRTTHRS